VAPAHDPVAVAAPVAAAAAPAPARAAEPVPLPAPPSPPPAPPAQAAPVGAAAAVAGADEAVTADDLELAELAAEYLWTVATGSRRPVVDLAARRFLRVGRARELLGRARARGILTGAGRGRPGGVLTDKGRRILEAGSRSADAPAWQDDAVPPAVAAPESGPPHLRLADGEEEEVHGSLSESVADSVDGTTGRTFTVLEGGARNLS
jgi:pyruvate dehydrogenase E2 component (dihydrolipoamide acetyltransferase)